MNILHLQNKINEFISIFVTQVKGATAMGRTDINKVSETILVPLLSEVYGYKNLKNLNYTESDNYPGIDLADDTSRVAFQITSTNDSEKIKHTLSKFIEYKLYEKYDKLIVYILTEKQKTYSGKGFEEIIKGKFTFDKDKDIQDYRDILKEIANLQFDTTFKIFKHLDSNFTCGNFQGIAQVKEPVNEKAYLGLQEVSFSDTLYIADLAIDRDDVIQQSKNQDASYKIKLDKKCSNVELVKAALEQKGLRFSVDWVSHEGQIITFHDLSNEFLQLAHVIDPQTVKSINTHSFYKKSDDYERVFKSLLGCCLRQKLYQKRVLWQNQEKLFIFSPEIQGENKRIEEWYGESKKNPSRTVYECKMKKNKPDEISFCKHFAFRVKYKLFGEQWYIAIQPEWYFSFDGYKKSFYAKDKIDWLKKNENNRTVFNHVKFIAYFLKYDKQSDIFTKRKKYNFLSFGEVVVFNNSPFLDDKDWHPEKSSDVPSDFEQLSLDFEL